MSITTYLDYANFITAARWMAEKAKHRELYVASYNINVHQTDYDARLFFDLCAEKHAKMLIGYGAPFEPSIAERNLKYLQYIRNRFNIRGLPNSHLKLISIEGEAIIGGFNLTGGSWFDAAVGIREPSNGARCGVADLRKYFKLLWDSAEKIKHKKFRTIAFGPAERRALLNQQL